MAGLKAASRRLFSFSFLTLFLLACGDRDKPPVIDPASAAAYTEFREEKDTLFRESPESPLPSEDKERFSQLRYFPVDLRLKFTGPIHTYSDPDRIEMLTTTGKLREFHVAAYFPFVIDGQRHRLQLYRAVETHPGHEPSYFVPFRDLTNGKETYGAGRYIDIPINEEDDVYTLDFNLAYNPYCTYSPEYSCPIPPRENHLKVAVRAGEMNYLKG